MVVGIISFLCLSVIDCIVIVIAWTYLVAAHRRQDAAENTYYDTSLRLLGLKPLEIFAEYRNADFLPADEIDALKRSKPTRLVLTFRGRKHVLEMFQGQQEPRTEFRIPSQELLADWLDEAKAERNQSDG